jgi:uncharacterized protein YecE (DUF72 family)
MRLHVGCAMWTHRSWQGRFLAHPLPAHERLRAYAAWCTAVEGNTTFYATPSRETVASWARQTDPEFRFVLKLPKVVTHDRRLTGAEEELRAFLDATDHRYAVEVRHPAFFDDPRAVRTLEETLTTVGAEWIPFDTPAFFRTPPTSDAEREAWTRKPRTPLRTRALTDRPIVRYLGRDDPARTVEGWQPWLDVVTGWLREGRSPTVFIHTPDNADAPDLARGFHREVRARLPEVQPLPEPTPVGQSTLF